jgi:hypothetical protein
MTGSDQNFSIGFKPEGISGDALAMLGLDRPIKGPEQAVNSLLTNGAMAKATIDNWAKGLANTLEINVVGDGPKAVTTAGAKQKGSDGRAM